MSFSILPPPLKEEVEGEQALQGFLPQVKDPSKVSADIEAYFQNYSPETVKAYKKDLDRYWSFINKPVQNTNEQDILRYLKSLDEKGYSNSTINRRLASLSKIISIYNVMGLMSYNPVQSLARVGKLYKPQTKEAQINKITMHDVQAVIANSSSKTAAMVRFLANTGVRISEMIHIRKEDLEPYDSEFMRIKITKAKGGKIRFVFLRYEIYQQVKNAFDSESELLFASKSGLKLNRSNIYNTISKAFWKQAYKKQIGPHDLRHFFATQLIVEKGKDYKAVSKALGHSSPAITLAVYTHSELSPEDSSII
jgi:site-specific recombinase XerD